MALTEQQRAIIDRLDAIPESEWTTLVAGLASSQRMQLVKAIEQTMTPRPGAPIPAWKRGEYGDLLAGLADYRFGDSAGEKLAAEAEQAWDMGHPISVVLHAANRAWAQNSPGSFQVILANHARDAYEKLARMHGQEPRPDAK